MTQGLSVHSAFVGDLSSVLSTLCQVAYSHLSSSRGFNTSDLSSVHTHTHGGGVRETDRPTQIHTETLIHNFEKTTPFMTKAISMRYLQLELLEQDIVYTSVIPDLERRG